ncbi:hypothetical protein [Kosakonia pseudosacchari]|uniref:hypothetical protein n=1 Tax=Kosakonia pseudosacchari TaxID=1646340 RepID=UPI001C3EC9F5|nr:hypothetical protein [Kosakonia pseudosacchari]
MDVIKKAPNQRFGSIKIIRGDSGSSTWTEYPEIPMTHKKKAAVAAFDKSVSPKFLPIQITFKARQQVLPLRGQSQQTSDPVRIAEIWLVHVRWHVPPMLYYISSAFL